MQYNNYGDCAGCNCCTVYVGNQDDQANVVTDEDEEYDDTNQEEDCTMGSPTGEREP